jgi:hypothetical protein
MFVANDPDPIEPFFLIVADHDRRVFAVEGPMTDDRPWEAAAKFAVVTSTASRVVRAEPIATRSPPNSAVPTILPVFRRAAS